MKGFRLGRCRRVVLLTAGLAFWSGVASAQIWRCVNPDGVVEYSNTKPPRDRSNCRPVDLPSLTTIPAPKTPPSQVIERSSGFPKVDASAQKARDADRREILERELGKEQELLARLKAEYKDGQPDRLGNERNYQKYLDRVASLKDRIDESTANIASLKRELDTLR